MKRNIYIIGVLFLLFAASARADKIDESTAYETALHYFDNLCNGIRSKSFLPRSVKRMPLSDSIRAYLYNDGAGSFVLIAAQDDTSPILGYGTYTQSDVHEGMTSLAQALGEGSGTAMPQSSEPVSAFENDLSPKTSAVIPPILRSIRNQYAPFNACCPRYAVNGAWVDSSRCLVGCVATALEQVITYYQFPNALQDTLWGWRTAHYAVDTIPKGTSINYSNILNNYNITNYSEENIQAVAELSYYCGIAAKMNWGLSESGANLHSLCSPMHSVFGYNYVRHLYAANYTPERWRELIDEELLAQRPIVYAGYTTLIQGHAFVIDGKDSNGFYHVNWGYGGNYDGYFNLSVLNTFENPTSPTETGVWLGHFCNQEMLLLHPDSIQWVAGDTITNIRNLKIDSVVYSRPPDGNGYVMVDVYARNVSDESIQAAVELLTFDIGEKEIFKKAEYVALTGLSLDPNATGKMTAYCRFTNTGEKVFGISDDDETFLYLDTLQIGANTNNSVSVVQVDTFRQENEWLFNVQVQNNSTIYWAGNMLTYSMFEGEYTTSGGEWRQWSVLNLPPGEAQTDTLHFTWLKPETSYTFVVRNPWLPVYSLRFVTSKQTTGVEATLADDAPESAIFTLDGYRVTQMNAPGIYLVRKGNKYVKVLHRK